jgi:hypothetical protein
VIQRTLAAIAQRQLGLITHDQATQVVTYRMIERLLDSGRLESVHRAVYRVSGAPVTYEQRVLAACLGAGADAVASHGVRRGSGGCSTRSRMSWRSPCLARSNTACAT